LPICRLFWTYPSTSGRPCLPLLRRWKRHCRHRCKKLSEAARAEEEEEEEEEEAQQVAWIRQRWRGKWQNSDDSSSKRVQLPHWR
jgi:hypothetical protein